MNYVDKVLGILGERDPIESMALFPGELRTHLESTEAGALGRPEAPGKWSILEVVHHLADTELVYGYRLRILLTIERPRFSRFHQTAWAERCDYRRLPLEEGLRLFEVQRGANLGLIRTLKADEWERSGVHSSRGEETVALMIKLWAGHDRLHLAQIERIREALACN